MRSETGVFQTSAAPALASGSYESETREVHGRSRTRLLNIDAQDAQDEEEVKFLQGKPAWVIIRPGFVDAQDYKLAVSRKILCILCIHVDHSFK